MPALSSYAPLFVRSNFSFLEGASHPEELVEEAQRLGLTHVALTDRDGVYGAVRAHTKARELGVHLLQGASLTVVDEELASRAYKHPCARDEDPPGETHLVLLACDRRGYANLCRLLSKGRLRSLKGESRVFWDEVCEHAAGLCALWGGERSLLTSSIVSDLHVDDVSARLKSAFEDR